MRREESSPQKVNMPEYTLLYLNQGDVSYKDNDMENVIIGKMLPLADVPSDLSTYELKPDEVKMLVTKYNKSTGQFLGIVKTIGQLIVREMRVKCSSITITVRKIANFSIVPVN